jgi:hypothetical protein
MPWCLQQVVLRLERDDEALEQLISVGVAVVAEAGGLYGLGLVMQEG